jgi:nitroreductase
MRGATSDVFDVMSTARAVRRFTDEPVDDATLTRCLEAARWAPSGANKQPWRFVVLRSEASRAAVASAAERALVEIAPIYGATRPADDDTSRRARSLRTFYEIHERAGAFTSVLFAVQALPSTPLLVLGGSIYPAMQNFLLAARAQGLGACPTAWASYGGEELLREAVGVPDDWLLAAHVMVGWPRGGHGPVRRRPLADVTYLDRWGAPATDLLTPGAERLRG